MRKIVFVLLALPAVGCGKLSTPSPRALATSSSTPTVAQEEPKSVAEKSKTWTDEEKRIAEIAKKAYLADGGTEIDFEVNRPFRSDDDRWLVTIGTLPSKPGSYSVVIIDSNEQVVRIRAGL